MNFEVGIEPSPKGKGIVCKIILSILFCLILGIGFGVYQVVSFLTTPGSMPGIEIEVSIPPGTTFHVLALHLKDIKAITDVDKFEALAKLLGITNKIKSGRFLINTGWKPKDLLDYFVSGKPVLDKITIPEGLSWWEVGRKLEKAGLVTFDDFKVVIHDTAFLREWGIPFRNAEGFLFPDTYLLARPFKQDIDSAKFIVGKLIENFWRRTSFFWPNGMRPSLKNMHAVKEALILASIIEKEARISNERVKISGVYANRLSIKMPLQACPTVIYGLGEGFKGPLKLSHLKDKKNEYNTYMYTGLPPGPIASPGIESIRAALQPEKHGYLYFVSRGDGSHIFNSNLKDHNRMKKIYKSQLRPGDNPMLVHGGISNPTDEISCPSDEEPMN